MAYRSFIYRFGVLNQPGTIGFRVDETLSVTTTEEFNVQLANRVTFAPRVFPAGNGAKFIKVTCRVSHSKYQEILNYFNQAPNPSPGGFQRDFSTIYAVQPNVALISMSASLEVAFASASAPDVYDRAWRLDLTFVRAI